MAVDNIVLDERVSLGFRGGPTFSTDKLVMVNGQERRMQNRDVAIHVYTWNYQNTSRDIHASLKEFWFDRRGDFKSWLLKDHADYSATAEPTGVGTGALTTFQLIKTYTAGSNPYQRTIRHIKSGTLTVYVDGVAQTPTTHYTVSSTGLVTFVSAPANGALVTASFEFYVPVRFDGDRFQSIVDYQPQMDIISVEDLTAIEIVP
jgi:uncharacterized protein (TIGR02217 family)